MKPCECNGLDQQKKSRNSKLPFFLFLFVFGFLFNSGYLWAHGIVGQRFFPATIAVDDPFVADEMDLLAYSNIKAPDPSNPAQNSLFQTYGMGISKRLTRDLGVELAVTYDQQNIIGGNIYGFENMEGTLKYVFYKNPVAESILAAGLSLEVGGTGTKAIADTTSTVTPTLYFGKGFGDLPDSVQYLRPFAVTGTAGIATPMVNTSDPVQDNSSSLKLGFTVMYSAMYLQSFVKDIGLPKPFSRTIPLVEFKAQSFMNGPQMGTTTAYAYPGFLWIGKAWELGLEAIIPMNSSTGSQTGVQALVHLFLDDLAPRIFTRTLSGEVLGPTQ
ncbi:MAG: hypothetical protein ACYDBV_08985 [Nitrospiria bacterium]